MIFTQKRKHAALPPQPHDVTCVIGGALTIDDGGVMPTNSRTKGTKGRKEGTEGRDEAKEAKEANEANELLLLFSLRRLNKNVRNGHA